MEKFSNFINSYKLSIKLKFIFRKSLKKFIFVYFADEKINFYLRIYNVNEKKRNSLHYMFFNLLDKPQIRVWILKV